MEDNKNYDELFCKNLIRLRKERNLRQLDLAADAEISKSSYRNYELGVFSPTVPILRRLAKALKVDFNELLGGYPSNREVSSEIRDIVKDLMVYQMERNEND